MQVTPASMHGIGLWTWATRVILPSETTEGTVSHTGESQDPLSTPSHRPGSHTYPFLILGRSEG